VRLSTPAIVLALRSHGEHGAVIPLLTPGHGLVAAYVRGARGRRMRPVLMAGNVVEARLSSRTEAQLPQAEVELVHSRGPLLSEPLIAAAIEWATVLTASALPEGQPYPPLYLALGALLDAIEAAPSASGWGAALVRFELLLLAELGFGLDLGRCAISGATDALVAVSPRSGRAVSAVEAEPYAGQLLSLPAFLREGGEASWSEIANGLALTGHFLARDVLTDRIGPSGEARARLVERLRRAGGSELSGPRGSPRAGQ
jgi:DNA repair protein RecO (recombination protein O)